MRGTLKRGLGAGALAAFLAVLVPYVAEASPLIESRSAYDPIAARFSLLRQVLIYAKEGSAKLVDGRWSLGQSEAKLGLVLSPDEKTQMMACIGQITCETPGSTEEEDRIRVKITATAVSVLKPALLVTAKHVFFKGRRAVVPFGSCSFRSYLNRNVAVPVRVETDQRRGYAFNNEDFIVLRLKRPLQGCGAFATNDPDQSLEEGDEILSVTAQQLHTLNKGSKREPLVARGKIRKAFDGVLGGPPFYYADIDLDEGGSGGAVFVLKDGRPVANADGRLVLRGLSVAFGPRARNGKPYSEDRNYTIVVGLEEDFRDLVRGKARTPPVVAPAACPQDGVAKIDVISESVPPAQTEALTPLLQQSACDSETTRGDRAGDAGANCFAKEFKKLKKEINALSASRHAKQKRAFSLKNDTSCTICFTYHRCNDYGCWDEAVSAGAGSTLFAGVSERAPVIKNPQFCNVKPAVADSESPLTPSGAVPASINAPAIADQAAIGSAGSPQHAAGNEAIFLAAKEKAKRKGVYMLTSEDIRGLSLEQIRELRGY